MYTVYRVLSLLWFEERGHREAFLGGFSEVFGWFGPFNMGKYLFWYSWFKRVKIKNEKIEEEFLKSKIGIFSDFQHFWQSIQKYKELFWKL